MLDKYAQMTFDRMCQLITQTFDLLDNIRQIDKVESLFGKQASLFMCPRIYIIIVCICGQLDDNMLVHAAIIP